METGFTEGQKVIIKDDQSSVYNKVGTVSSITGTTTGDDSRVYAIMVEDQKCYYSEKWLEAAPEPPTANLTDKVPYIPQAVRKEESGQYTLIGKELTEAREGTTLLLSAYEVKPFIDPDYGLLNERTVGSLLWDHIHAKQTINKITRAMEDVLERMHEFANSAGLCSQYDEAVDDLNSSIESYCPHWAFRFSPRERQYQVTIRREVSVIEEATIYLNAPTSADSYVISDLATEDAHMLDDSEWEERDREYQDMEVVDYFQTD
jgi:hypothetical protein